tara:strand:- start:1047 stop:1841 length:795 start_codon:yes stop_codon:yes gene_type:complete
MIRFKNISEKIANPYPIIVFKDFLDNQEIKYMSEYFKKNKTDFDKNVMGGRNTVLKGGIKYRTFIEKNILGKTLDDFFDNPETFNYIKKELDNCKTKSKRKFYTKFNSFTYKKNYLEELKDRFFISKIKNKLIRYHSQIKDRGIIHCHMDFSEAKAGYQREPHHDTENRIISFLLYFNDFEQNNGGNFQIYDFLSENESYSKRPNINNLKLVKEITPTAGTLVAFYSSPNSIHGVEKIKSDSPSRCFMYGSYTNINDINWKFTK